MEPSALALGRNILCRHHYYILRIGKELPVVEKRIGRSFRKAYSNLATSFLAISDGFGHNTSSIKPEQDCLRPPLTTTLLPHVYLQTVFPDCRSVHLRSINKFSSSGSCERHFAIASRLLGDIRRTITCMISSHFSNIYLIQPP